MMKSWSRRLSLAILAAAFAGIALLYLAANVFFQPERLVRKLEKRLNCRAAIRAVELSLFSQPARLIIHDLALADRDDFARKGTPLAERPALSNPLITAKQLSLTVSFPHLLVGKIHVQELFGSEVHATLIKPEEGDHSLDRLFDKPDDEESDETDGDAEDDETEDDEDEEGNTIDRLKVPATMRSARLENSSFVIELVKKKTRITWRDVNVSLTNVEISPADLANKNHADLTIAAKVGFDHLEEDLHYGEMILRGEAAVKPVDVQTREIKPEADFRLRVMKGSYVETSPLIDAMARKLEDLEKYGIRLGDIKLEGNLENETVVHGHYRDHYFTLTQDTVVDFRDYYVGLKEGSWYESEENFHEFHTSLTAGPAITGAVLESVDGYISRKAGFLPPDIFRRLIGEHFLEEGHFTLKLITKGDIGRPTVAFSEKLPDIDVNAVKDSAKDLLDELKSIFR